MDKPTETLSQSFAREWRARYGTEPFTVPGGRTGAWRKTDAEILAAMSPEARDRMIYPLRYVGKGKR
jgi:hypothetical protein